MSLSTRERKTLLAYRIFRKQSPTISQLWRPVIPRFLLLVPLAAAAYILTTESVTIFLAGLGLGGLLRQLSILWTSTKVVPILIEVIDWDVVDQLLETPAEGKVQSA